MSIDHYENFPVASILLPAHLRPAVQAIYIFARTADDLADEGDAQPSERLTALRNYEVPLQEIIQGTTPKDKQFQRLQQVIRQYRLPVAPFQQLLSAFRQDVVKTRYANHDELLDYCARSANPVGHLMLHLYGAATAQNCRDSDAICSALQIINFLQDVSIDWQKQRIYLPLEDLQRFRVTEADISASQQHHRNSNEWQALMQFEIHRTRELMQSGSALAKRLPGRIGWELRGVVQGGLRILERIEMVQGDVFRHRPVLTTRDWIIIGWRMLTR